MNIQRFITVVLAAASPLLVHDAADAQMHIGPQVSVGTESGLGLGARLNFPLRTGALGVDGVLDSSWFFGGGEGVQRWIDTNVGIRIPVPLAADFATRIGGGVNFTYISFEEVAGEDANESELGLNVAGSISMPDRRFSPFVQLRLIATGAEQLVLTGGFTVGSVR